MSAPELDRGPVSEETPLLREINPALAGSDEAQDHELVPEERSTRELVVILGSIWVGVFLAALGK